MLPDVLAHEQHEQVLVQRVAGGKEQVYQFIEVQVQSDAVLNQTLQEPGPYVKEVHAAQRQVLVNFLLELENGSPLSVKAVEYCLVLEQAGELFEQRGELKLVC